MLVENKVVIFQKGIFRWANRYISIHRCTSIVFDYF